MKATLLLSALAAVLAGVAHGESSGDPPPTDGLVVSPSVGGAPEIVETIDPGPPPLDYSVKIGTFGTSPQVGVGLRRGRGWLARLDSGMLAIAPASGSVSRGAFVAVGLRGTTGERWRVFVESGLGIARISAISNNLPSFDFAFVATAGLGGDYALSEHLRVEAGLAAFLMPFPPANQSAPLPAMTFGPRLALSFDMSIR